jgi:hypothetical protein
MNTPELWVDPALDQLTNHLWADSQPTSRARDRVWPAGGNYCIFLGEEIRNRLCWKWASLRNVNGGL